MDKKKILILPLIFIIFAGFNIIPKSHAQSLDVIIIDTSDGIYIVTSRYTFIIKEADFPKGNIIIIEDKVNEIVQGWFEERIPLSEIPDNDPIKSGILLPNERIEDDELVTIIMYVNVYIFTLNPLDFVIRCSKEPIPDFWWVGLR